MHSYLQILIFIRLRGSSLKNNLKKKIVKYSGLSNLLKWLPRSFLPFKEAEEAVLDLPSNILEREKKDIFPS